MDNEKEYKERRKRFINLTSEMKTTLELEISIEILKRQLEQQKKINKDIDEAVKILEREKE